MLIGCAVCSVVAMSTLCVPWGRRGGVRVLQHIRPFVTARMHCSFSAADSTYTIQSGNVRRFGLTSAVPPSLKFIVVDGQQLPVATLALGAHYCKLGGSDWAICKGDFTLYERSVANSGPGTQVRWCLAAEWVRCASLT